MRLNTLVLALVLCGGAMLPAGATVKVIELGHEAEPRMIRMPDRDNGELSLQTCASCKVLRLRATAETLYVIGGQPVTLKEMSKYLQSNPEANVVVMQRKDTATLSRVVVHVARGARQ
ncbi:MAG TPA: hypothetical protein VJN68_14135 [Burkholderiaceae bacterium]|nr:hypothetical protein [Burkholderiaceae bacterium]